MYSVSGSARHEEQWRLLMHPGGGLLDTVTMPKELPHWLSAEALSYYVNTYRHTGFSPPLNLYRIRDANWSRMAPYADTKIKQPVLFVGGASDPARPMFQSHFDNLESQLPNLTGKHLLAGIGHAIPEEAPEALNE